MQTDALLQRDGDLTPFLTIERTHPTTPTPFTHEAIPEPIRSTFVEAQRLLFNTHWTAAAITCRRVVELLVDHQDVPRTGSLQQRIPLLPVPDCLKGWAHLVRRFGNLAVHAEERVTQAEAEEAIELTRHLLEYLYILPDRVRHLQARFHREPPILSRS